MLSVGEATASGLGAVVDKLTGQKMSAPRIRGVLGENFLTRFDFLIDYKQHLLRFEEPGAPYRNPLTR